MHTLPAFYLVDGHHLPGDREPPGVAQAPEQMPPHPKRQDRLFPEVSAGTAERVLGGDLLYTVRRHALQ